MIIAPDVDLPDQVLQQHAAILGRTGSGKTFTAKGIVEKLALAGRRVCVLDPTGVWWGLASSADGSAGPFPVAIFGGRHGHVPITEHAGAALGELIAAQHLVSVIDLRDMLTSQQRRFTARFFEALYQHNTRPLHLVVDEADEFGPQNPGRGGQGGEENAAARCLGQFDRIARRGRTRGFRLMVITQRPAKLNKDILGQAATLVSMQLTLPHDREAVKAWVADQADPAAGKEVIGSLPKLRRGEGWVWSPDAEVLTRTVFPPIATFDSSSTPDDDQAGAESSPVTLADVDLTEVRAAMAAAIEEAEDSDVEALRAKVKRLTEERDAALRTPVSVADGEVAQLREQVRLLDAKLSGMAPIFDTIERATRRAETSAAEGLKRTMDVFCAEVAAAIEEQRQGLDRLDIGIGRANATSISPSHSPHKSGTVAEGIARPQQKILDAIAWWNAVGISSPARAQVAFMSDYAPGGGTFRNLLSECRSAGLISDVGDGELVLTPAGQRKACTPARPGGLRELHDRIRGRLTGPQRKLMDVLIGNGGREIPRTVLAEMAGYEASGGTFRNLMSECRTLGLITTSPKGTTVQASRLLFPEELR